MGMYAIKRRNEIIGFSEKKWLLRIYMMEKMYSREYKIHKIKNNELNIIDINHDKSIHYFCGYALTRKEIDVVEYLMSFHPNIKEFEKLYKKFPKGKKLVRYYTEFGYEEGIRTFIKLILRNDSYLEDILQQKNFMNSIKGV